MANKLHTELTEFDGKWYTVKYYWTYSPEGSYPEVEFVYDENEEELPDSILRDDIIAATFED